ncbi:hypothetical protein P7K49_013264, partial [Saguinus oedipus]
PTEPPTAWPHFRVHAQDPTSRSPRNRHAPGRHHLAQQDAGPSSVHPAGPARRCCGNGATPEASEASNTARREE